MAVSKKINWKLFILTLAFIISIVSCGNGSTGGPIFGPNDTGSGSTGSGSGGAGSSGGGTGSGSGIGANTGKLTITDIPSVFNGAYAAYSGYDSYYDMDIVGAQNINLVMETAVLSRISNGRVSLPIWRINSVNNTVTGYFGNGTFFDNYMVIFNSAILPDAVWPLEEMTFDYITFTNGNATISFNDGRPPVSSSGGGGGSGIDVPPLPGYEW